MPTYIILSAKIFKISYKSNYAKISYMIAYNNLIGKSICFINLHPATNKKMYR